MRLKRSYVASFHFLTSVSTCPAALIELARWAGADNIYTTASEKFHSRLQFGLKAVCLPSDPAKWLPMVQGKMDVVIDSICKDGYVSPRKALNENGKLVCIGLTNILYSNEKSVFGMPAAAIWASTKAKLFMSQTTTYEIWESFQDNPEKFKVRV